MESNMASLGIILCGLCEDMEDFLHAGKYYDKVPITYHHSQVPIPACRQIGEERIMHLNCKYYEADIRVKVVKTRTHLIGVEAVLLYFDSHQLSSWNSAVEWMQFVKETDLPHRLLVCQTLCASALPPNAEGDLSWFRLQALDYEFELIELDPVDISLDEDEEFGAPRLKSALEAHTWSNMSLRDAVRTPASHQSISKSSSSKGLVGTGCNVDESNESFSESSSDHFEIDATVDSFERAMQTLLHSRQHINSTITNRLERHKVAEQVTLKFWRAIDGSDEEVEGLGDEDATATRN